MVHSYLINWDLMVQYTACNGAYTILAFCGISSCSQFCLPAHLALPKTFFYKSKLESSLHSLFSGFGYQRVSLKL